MLVGGTSRSWGRARSGRALWSAVLLSTLLALVACGPAAAPAPTSAPAKPAEATKPAASPAGVVIVRSKTAERRPRL
jgi:hypothetical protein